MLLARFRHPGALTTLGKWWATPPGLGVMAMKSSDRLSRSRLKKEIQTGNPG
jgi:hypothetical protein